MESVTHQSSRRLGGFTLIELMIVVAVVAILALVAYPSYMESVRKSRRADAITELNKVAQAQERWRANNPNFNNADVSSAVATGLGLVGGTTVATNYTLSSGYYTITIGTAAASPTTYTATATAVGSQASDAKCATLTMTMNTGNINPGIVGYTSTGTATANQCWNR